MCENQPVLRETLILYSFIPEEYERLWAAVTGGRGTGRGTKKKIVKGVDPKLLKYGKQIFSLTIGTLFCFFTIIEHFIHQFLLALYYLLYMNTAAYSNFAKQSGFLFGHIDTCTCTCTCTVVCDPHISGGS